MELSWSLLLLCIAFSGFALFWHDALGARELDGTVAFRSIKVVRGVGGRLAFERTYVFDYTLDGNTRQQGFVVMFGQRVETIGLD